jgi:hypothetical protein
MTTIKYSVTHMKEEELSSVSFIEPLLVSDEIVSMMEYRSYSLISVVTMRMEQPFSTLDQVQVKSTSSIGKSCRQCRGHTPRQ